MHKVKTDAYVVSIVRSLLGNLMGEKSRLFEMGEFVVNPQDLPADMGFERQVLELIFKYADTPQPATILNHLLLNAKPEQHEKIKADFNLLQATDDRAIRPLAYPLKHWAERRDMEAAVEYAERKLGENRADNAGVFKEILDRMVDSKPSSADKAKRVTNLERIDEYAKKQDDRLHGKATASGPRWPWKALNLLIPVWRASDLVQMFAQTKMGKSTLLSVAAEGFAWDQGFDVFKLNFETDHESFQERQFARHLLMPIQYQRNPKIFNPKDDTPRLFLPNSQKTSSQQLFGQFREYVKGKADDMGQVVELHCPRYSIAEMKNAIDMERRLSMKRGRKLIVIIDHLQAIPRNAAFGKDNEVLEDYINEIKGIPETYAETEWPVYTILIDQERSNEDDVVPDDPEKIMKKLKSIRSRGTSAGSIRSQIQISLQRPIASNDAPVWVPGEHGLQALDSLGNPRWYHRMGQADGYCWLFVVRANEGSSGWVDVRIENELYRVEEADRQTCPIIMDRLDQEQKTLERMGLA